MSSNNDAPAYEPVSEPSMSGTNLVSEQDNADLLPAYAEATSARPVKQKKLEITVDKNGKPLVSFMLYVHEALSSTNVGTILEGSGPLRGAVRLDSDAPNPVRSIVLTVVSINSLCLSPSYHLYRFKANT